MIPSELGLSVLIVDSYYIISLRVKWDIFCELAQNAQGWHNASKIRIIEKLHIAPSPGT